MKWTRYLALAGLAVLIGALALVDCSSKGGCVVDATYDPSIIPADFVPGIDNSLMPLVPGTIYAYEGTDETVSVAVTGTTKTIMEVTCIEVRDTVRVLGSVVEDTLDWYAQDADGNVWYFGEDTREYAGSEVVSTEGSWEAGVDGAKPGIVMFAPTALPPAGSAYRQEYYACEAEDFAEVAATGQSVTVPAGTFDRCLQTREFTPLEPDVNENKWYAPGVGLVLERDIATGAMVRLMSVSTP